MESDFESIFRKFVTSFGGEVLPENPSSSKMADYLFRKQNVIAELKCLMQDQTDAMNKKVSDAAVKWIKKNGALPSGYDGAFLDIAAAPKDLSDKWLRILKAPIESFVRDANRQIRESKKHLELPGAQGLLFIFNQGNFLYNRPKDFRLLIGNVVCKRDLLGQLRFPNIHGVVYFSFETGRSEKEQMSFWAPLQLRETADEDLTRMQNFQAELRDAFYAIIAARSGKTASKFDID
jgi:hypothetical protein